MAITSNPLIGAAKQKMGGAVFSTWKGKYVLKTKPASVANPKTPAQVAQRSAMTQSIAILRLTPLQIKRGFKKLAVGKSEANAFISSILKTGFDFSVAGVATLVPTSVLFSKGTISPTPILTIVADRSLNNVDFTFSSVANDESQALLDKTVKGVYNSTQDEWVFDSFPNDRQDGNAGVEMPAGWAIGDTVIGYLGFYNETTGNSSDSLNASTTIIA
jgi:hypothetical protein